MTVLETTSQLCLPRWATPRTPERPTLGGEVAKVAELLGQPFMPWQRLVADVALELLPNGLPAYRLVVVTVPRQSGKTTLLLGVEAHRCVRWPKQPQQVAYTAQTGWDARRKLIDDQAPMLLRSPLKAAVDRVLRGVGNESISWVTGSRIIVLANSEESGHGKTIDLAVLDELFADTDERREQAVTPAMSTRADAQAWVVSTMGTDESVALNRKVELGRAAVENGEREGIAYFEWSADPDDDPDDEAVWARCMPALGHTITAATVRQARRTMSDGEFRRSFLNLRQSGDARKIPAAVWELAQGDVSPTGELVWGIDATPERDRAAIVVGSRSGDEVVCELVAHGLGTAWLLPALIEKVAKHGGVVAGDPNGPAGSALLEAKAHGLPTVDVGGRLMAQACGEVVERLNAGRLKVRPHPELAAAAAAAVAKKSGDVWVWSRRDITCDVCSLVAMTCVVGGLLAAPSSPAYAGSFVDLDDY